MDGAGNWSAVRVMHSACKPFAEVLQHSESAVRFLRLRISPHQQATVTIAL